MGKAKLLGTDLVQVKPFGKPLGKLIYVDYVYETLLEIRKKKLDKIMKKMK